MKKRPDPNDIFLSLLGANFNNLASESILCLASQASFDRIFWLSELADRWQDAAPISLSLFVPDVDYELSKFYLNVLFNCKPRLANQITIHLVYPIDWTPEQEIKINETVLHCGFSHQHLVQELLSKYQTEEVMNPS